MPRKPHNQRWQRILDGLAEYIESAEAEEILEEGRLENRDPGQIAEHVRGVLKGAVRAHQQQERARAREGYEHEVVALNQQKIELPEDPATRRHWLAAVFQQQPTLTLQNRDFNELTDEDVEIHLRNAVMLGCLKDVKLPNDDD